jgi:hypothetical protein
MMSRQRQAVDGGEPRPEPSTAGFDRRRAVGGGLLLLGAVAGFTAARAIIDGAGLPDEWTLVALPAFGLVGVVGFVLLVSAVVGD